MYHTGKQMELRDQCSAMLSYEAKVILDDLAIFKEENCLAFKGGLWLHRSLVYLKVYFLESYLK